MTRRLLGLGSLLVVLAIATGCGSAAGSPSAAAATARVTASIRPAAATSTPTAAPTPASTAPGSSGPSGSGGSGGSGAASTTTIDWGVIWDTLPAGFPSYPGSTPTTTGGGPASAILDIPAGAAAASTWFQAALVAAGFQVTGANGPREDGSYDIVAATGLAGCQAEISLAPLGTVTTATIYLAAACPFR
jgi:hypothetical protein